MCGCGIRVCVAFALAGSPNKQFMQFPKSVDNQVLQVCFDRFREINFHRQFYSCLTEHEISVVVSFFQLVEKETLCECGFPVGVGARMFIPNANSSDAPSREKLIEEVRATKSITESYI